MPKRNGQTVLDVEDDADPYTLKVPENPDHRRIVDAIGIVGARQLRPNTVVYRDMNWYPSEGGHAMAPDLMTLPAGGQYCGGVIDMHRVAAFAVAAFIIIVVPGPSVMFVVTRGFFSAVLPQFVDRSRGGVTAQMLVYLPPPRLTY